MPERNAAEALVRRLEIIGQALAVRLVVVDDEHFLVAELLRERGQRAALAAVLRAHAEVGVRVGVGRAQLLGIVADRQAVVGVRRRDLRETGVVGERDLGFCDVGVERPDHRHHRAIGNERLDVLRAGRGIVLALHGIVERARLELPAAAGKTVRVRLFDREHGTVLRRNADRGIGAADRQIDPDPQRAERRRTGTRSRQKRDEHAREASTRHVRQLH